MLRSTFLHLPGIGAHKERLLWKARILTWDDYEQTFLAQRPLFAFDRGISAAAILEASQNALAKGDLDFFAERLPQREHYRIALTVPEKTVFLDIETTGLSQYYDHTTIVGLSSNDGYYCHIRHAGRERLREILSEAKCIVTFNGTLFDLKFVRKEFSELPLPKAHVDLRYLARSVGLSGGQKTVEQKLGLERIQAIKGMQGERAPLLWHEYRLGDRSAARVLIEYNHADTEGMKFIFDEVVRRVLHAVAPPNSIGPSFSKQMNEISWADRKAEEAKNRVYVPPFRGKRGPQVTYRELVEGQNAADLRVVGIDLSGSEKRASGWCLLDGEVASTKSLHTDRQIIQNTIRVQPHLVSIDSPLSLPKGRRTVHDDDPGRHEYGILRRCERVLMQRGVKVYPSLIKSMQGLTARGIRLASLLRKRGFPVIESYPGAAQDIMRIPRKRAGLEYLKKGLGDFGVRGDFHVAKVSHDEVDAVTAAIVGVFFWSGRFEALGNEDEDYLIIPDLRISPKQWRSRLVVGFSGPIAAGKTTAARYVEGRGFAYGRFGLVLKDLLELDGRKVDRDALQEIGDRVHRSPGQRWLCRQLVAKMPSNRNLVIDGLRWPEDHASLIEAYGPAFRHIHIGASKEIRKARYVADGSTAREFEVASRHPVEQHVEKTANTSLLRIRNETSRGGFTARLARAMIAVQRLEKR